MKSICGFLLFGTAVVSCLSNVHVIAEKFDCTLDIRIPDAVMNVCPDLRRDKDFEDSVGKYMSDTVMEVHKRIYENCNSSVEQLCDDLPEIVVTSNVGGREQCKEDLKELMCEKTPNYFKGRLSYLCDYYEAVSTIIAKPDKWDADEKNAVCALFKGNHIVCYMATKQMCDRINSVLVKHHCKKALDRGICDG